MALAHVFTGQGFNSSQVPDYTHNPYLGDVSRSFQSRFGYALVPFDRLSEADLRRNEMSAAILLLSALQQARRARDHLEQPDLVAGYSVGQFLALYYAGALGLQDTIDLVFDRCKVMNDAVRSVGSTLIAVVGLSLEKLREVIDSHGLTDRAFLANDNAVGNLTLAVSRTDIATLQSGCLAAGAFRVVELQTDGGWHSRYLIPAQQPFQVVLKKYGFLKPQIPIVDNTYVDIESLSGVRLQDTLTEHLVSTVRWRETVKFFTESGVTEVVEITDFDLLARMSTFTAPKVRFLTMAKACAA